MGELKKAEKGGEEIVEMELTNVDEDLT